MAKPEHHARWRSRKVGASDSAGMMNPNVRPRLRSQIGEVRGSLCRISAAEYLAREAAVVRGGAGAKPPSSSSSSSKAATGGTNQSFQVTRDSAVHGGAGKGPSPWPPKAPPHATKRLEPRPEASAAPPAPKRRKTTIQATEPPARTPASLALEALRVVPERRNAEPEVLVRASYLKTRFAGLIAKAAETLSVRHRQELERRPAAGVDDGSRAEGELALLQMEERNARVDALRKMTRESLHEVERNGRVTGLSVETIHPAHLMELGITAVENVGSPERSREGALPGAPKQCRRCSPLEELGLFVKPVDDCSEEDMET